MVDFFETIGAVEPDFDDLLLAAGAVPPLVLFDGVLTVVPLVGVLEVLELEGPLVLAPEAVVDDAANTGARGVRLNARITRTERVLDIFRFRLMREKVFMAPRSDSTESTS